jgi:putative transposase
MLKSYRYRLYPTQDQTEHIVQAMGCARYIYNKGLEENIRHYAKTGKTLQFFDLCNKFLPEEKRANAWLSVPAAQTLCAALQHLTTAYVRFFKNQSEFPQFKKKNNRQSVQYIQNVWVDFGQSFTKIPKLGKVRAVFDRTFTGKIKTCTVSKTPTNKFFISILVDDGADLPLKAPIDPATSVGIDLGIKDFAILSDSTKVANPKFLRKKIDRLKVLQRRASKKVKGSNNRRKANLKVARLYEIISNQRKDFLQKLSSKIIRENQTVILEKLNVSGMIRNHKLAQAISDVSWSEFVRQLTYKAEWQGKNLLFIGRFDPSTKMCSNCGHLNNDLTLKDRRWACPSCKTEHDRDINAATNIKKFGLIRSKEGHRLISPQTETLSGLERPAELAETPSSTTTVVVSGSKKGQRRKKSLVSADI